MSEKPEALQAAESLEQAIQFYSAGLENSDNHMTLLAFAADKFRRLHAENERLREENRLWYSRAVALFWKCDTDNITAGRLQSAAKEIDAALRREYV